MLVKVRICTPSKHGCSLPFAGLSTVHILNNLYHMYLKLGKDRLFWVVASYTLLQLYLPFASHQNIAYACTILKFGNTSFHLCLFY